MSRLGNIQESYGKQVSIAVANTYSSNVLASTLLPKNTLIISAPVTTSYGSITDIGTYNLIMTDANGQPVRLTYTIQEGNGLTADSDNTDILRLSIDNDTLGTTENGALIANTQQIIDNSTLVVDDFGNISVNAENLTHAALDQLGVVAIDNHTIKKTIGNQIYIDTENLDRANNNSVGIVVSDNNTINIDEDGVMSVNTWNLLHGGSTNAGVIKIDGSTIKITDSSMYVSTNNLKLASNYNVGVAKVDGVTLTASAGVISANLANFAKANNTSFGLVKYDTNSIAIQNGVASVKDHDRLFSYIVLQQSLLSDLQKSIDELNDLVFNNKLTRSRGIYSLTCNNSMITNLVRPEYLEEPVNMKTQHIYLSMNIICDCDFNISVLFDNNETPAVELAQINYNDEFSYQGYEGLLKEYPSTDMKQKRVILLFNCKNFKATRAASEKTTKVTVTVSSVANKEIKKTLLYSIVRYNSNVLQTDNTDTITEEEIISTTIYTAIENESFWIEDLSVANKKTTA